MNRMPFLLIYLLLIGASLHGQDIIDSGDISPIEDFRVDLNQRFSFGRHYKKSDHEDAEGFVQRVLGSNATLHHGAFELVQFRNCIVSFGTYDYQGISIVIGFLFEPTSIKNEYRLLKTIELSSGCGNPPEIVSVFLHDATPNTIGKELIIHGTDNCGIHGTNNYVYVYNGLMAANKLVLTTYLSERCDYSEIKIDGGWDFDMGDKNVEERRYNKCKYPDFKAIRIALDQLKKKK